MCTAKKVAGAQVAGASRFRICMKGCLKLREGHLRARVQRASSACLPCRDMAKQAELHLALTRAMPVALLSQTKVTSTPKTSGKGSASQKLRLPSSDCGVCNCHVPLEPSRSSHSLPLSQSSCRSQSLPRRTEPYLEVRMRTAGEPWSACVWAALRYLLPDVRQRRP